MSSLGIWSRALTPSTYVDTDPNIPNRHGPQPNISNGSWYQANNLFLTPQLSAPAPQSISTDVIPDEISATDVRDPTIYVSSQEPSSSDDKSPPNFSQQTPRSHELSPTTNLTTWNIVNRRQGFQNRRSDPSGAVWNVDSRWSSDTLVGSSSLLYTRKTVCLSFYVGVSCAPF